ncbi:cytochrome P450 [Scleroderma yunnanense]
MGFSLILGAAGVVLLGLWLVIYNWNHHSLPHPPGPKGLPIIGNAFQINRREPQLTYTTWGKIHGDILYFHIFHQDFIIVNSESIAHLLADKRSVIYSDRPHSPIYRLFGVGRMTPLMKYGEDWRIHRKLSHISLRSNVAENYHDLYLSNARQLLHDLQQSGATFSEHFKLFAGALAFELSYGRKVEGKNDPVIKLVGQIFNILSEGATTEICYHGLPAKISIVEHFPSWFPGLGFKKGAPLCRKLIANLSELPFSEAKQLKSGTLPQCLVSDFLAHGGVEESAVKDAVAGIYLGLFALFSTSLTLETLVLVLLLYPEVQEKVHAELDAVVGKDRLQLPYLQAVLFETMRWRPVFPGMAYNCPDPDRFDPSRHLTSDGHLIPQAKQNNDLFFGFGRRVCPGRFFADNALWVAAAMILSALRFEKAKDAFGNDIPVKPEFTCGLISHPLPFECSITSRI